MSSRAYAAASRRSGQVDLTLACMRQVRQVSCLIPHIHPLGMPCHHTSLHKFRTIKRHLRRNQIRARVPRRTPTTLLPHRKAEVAVERPAKREKHRRPSSSDCISLVATHLFFWLLSSVDSMCIFTKSALSHRPRGCHAASLSV
jgi:hypothetical protein